MIRLLLIPLALFIAIAKGRRPSLWMVLTFVSPWFFALLLLMRQRPIRKVFPDWFVEYYQKRKVDQEIDRLEIQFK